MTDYNLTIRYVASLITLVYLVHSGTISTELLLGVISGLLFPTTATKQKLKEIAEVIPPKKQPPERVTL
jgi:hypothetical protein